MNNRSFFNRIAVLTLIASVPLVLLTSLAQPAHQHALFAAATVVLFVLVCVGLFFAGTSAVRSGSKYAFTNLVSVSVFGKMVLALAWLFIYQKTFHPLNQWFVGIFLYLYVVYTAFEVWFMTRLAKS
ncbi:MAG: hypothetical protein ACKOCH_24880 [Bacteroidota bacterium]